MSVLMTADTYETRSSQPQKYRTIRIKYNPLYFGNVIGTFISPFSPALWLAVGLAGIEMGRYIRYAFWWIWAFSILAMAVAFIMGII